MAEGFEDLKIWKNGYELALEVADLTLLFPDTQKYGLTVQILKSSNSIIANIAEAQGRFHYLDKIRVLYISRGELFETRSHLKVALGLKYISEEQYLPLDSEYQSLLISLNSYINYLQQKNSDSVGD